MKEKLKTLSVAELRELAKLQGMKGSSSKRKQELVDWLSERYEEGIRERRRPPERIPRRRERRERRKSR